MINLIFFYFHIQKLKAINWYTERALTEISLGGLLILIVIRTIQYNMLKMRDKYLHTNCLAALANMSSQFRDLHPYVSQRLISLYETLAKKYHKLVERIKLESQNQKTEVTVTVNQDDMDQDLSVLEEVLRMVLEILNSCLSTQLANNPNLIYTLLYNKHYFEMLKDNIVFQDIIHNIDTIIKFFSQLLQEKSQLHEVDAHQVLQVIQQGARSWPRDKLTVSRLARLSTGRPQSRDLDTIYTRHFQYPVIIQWFIEVIKVFDRYLL